MSVAAIPPPSADEYPPAHAPYIAKVADRDPVRLLVRQATSLEAGIRGISEERARHRYAAGKWSVKEVLGHLADAERVFAYRLFRIARGDATPLSGFDEDAYVAAAHFDARSVDDLLNDFLSLRADTSRLVAGISPESWTNRGIANAHPVTVRALIYLLPGHVAHHVGILRDRYGLQIADGD